MRRSANQLVIDPLSFQSVVDVRQSGPVTLHKTFVLDYCETCGEPVMAANSFWCSRIPELRVWACLTPSEQYYNDDTDACTCDHCSHWSAEKMERVLRARP